MLKLLKTEMIYRENFKGIGEYKDVLCPFEHLIRFCESKHGKKETWEYIEKLFKEADRNTQSSLIRVCCERYDPDTDIQRMQVLFDLVCGYILDDNLRNGVVGVLGSVFDEVRSPRETYKEILSKINRSTHEDVYQSASIGLILTGDFNINSKSLLRNTAIQNEWNEYDQLYEFVKKRLVRDYTKEEAVEAFTFLINHEYATEESIKSSKKLLNEVMLK